MEFLNLMIVDDSSLEQKFWYFSNKKYVII